MNLRPVIDYFEQTVRPTVDEFYADEMNMRRGPIAAIVLYHVYDYAKSNGFGKPGDSLQGKNKMLYEVVHAVANASKHFQLHQHAIARHVEQIASDHNEGLFSAPFGDGVFTEANGIYLILDEPQSHDGRDFERVELKSAIKFVFTFWESEIMRFKEDYKHNPY
ncbi:hypothetical protein RAC65_09590 [Pantoea sp. BS_8]